MNEKNAIITNATITNDDHGVLSAWLTLDFGGGGQGFGGYALYLPRNFKHHKGAANLAGLFIWRVMEIAEVSEWGKVVGKTIRARGEEYGQIDAIGHIIKDDWFNPVCIFQFAWSCQTHRHCVGHQVAS